MNDFDKLNLYLNAPTNKEKSIKSDIRYILKNIYSTYLFKRLSDNRPYNMDAHQQIEIDEIYKYIMKNFEEKVK